MHAAEADGLQGLGFQGPCGSRPGPGGCRVLKSDPAAVVVGKGSDPAGGIPLDLEGPGTLISISVRL